MRGAAVIVSGDTVGTLTLTATGALTFQPAAGFHGELRRGLHAFRRPQPDRRGRVNITVASVNDPPAGADKTIATLEDTSYTLTAADFGFTDPNDSPANAFASVTVFPLTGGGTLTYNGAPVTAATIVPVVNIGQLVV